MACDISAVALPDLFFTGDALANEQLETRTVGVLHIINGEHYSGAERVQDLLALRLPEFGFAADFACLKLNRFGVCRQSQTAELFDLPMRSRIDLGPAYKLASLIRRRQYQVLHSHTPRAALIGRVAAALSGVPLVHHVHSPTAVDSTRRWHNRLNTTIERLSLGRAAGVIAVSRSLGEYARRQGIDPPLIHVVPNGVPVQGPLADRPAPCGTWTLGIVALFRPRKGLETLLEALALAQSGYADSRTGRRRLRDPAVRSTYPARGRAARGRRAHRLDRLYARRVG